MSNALSALLKTKKHPVIDGAMATELEKLGVDTAHELWSAAALLNQPEVIARVHHAYFEAGADFATTNTYQANIAAFVAQGLTHDQSAELIKSAVHIAVASRNEWCVAHGVSAAEKLVAASVGPYGAYLADGSEYTGAYSLTDAEFRDFHRPRMELMQEAGADFFALETMPNAPEVVALLGLLADDFADAEAWLSLSLADADHLCDGSAVRDLAPLVNASDQVVAVGLNCIALENVALALEFFSSVFDKPLLVYPNSGEKYDPATKTWAPAEPGETFQALVSSWLEAGATMIGGCCRTTPADIAQIASMV